MTITLQEHEIEKACIAYIKAALQSSGLPDPTEARLLYGGNGVMTCDVEIGEKTPP